MSVLIECASWCSGRNWTVFFFFNDTATTEIYTLSLHDALPIFPRGRARRGGLVGSPDQGERGRGDTLWRAGRFGRQADRRCPRHRRLPAARAFRARPPLLYVGVGRRLKVDCTVNGSRHVADGVWEGESLLYVLRERFGLYGSKNACEQGECGSCSVYL